MRHCTNACAIIKRDKDPDGQGPADDTATAAVVMRWFGDPRELTLRCALEPRGVEEPAAGLKCML